MKKRKMKGWMIGLYLGLLAALIKILIRGGTHFDFSVSSRIYALVSIPLFGLLFGYLIQKYYPLNKFYKLLFTLVISSFILSLNYWINLYLFLSESSEFVGLISLLSIVLFFIVESVFIALVGLITYILYIIFHRTKLLFPSLNFIIIWFTTVWLVINDMMENFNVGGPNGKWYLYGDLVLLIGVIIIILLGLLKKNAQD